MPFHSDIAAPYQLGAAVKYAPAIAAGLIAFLTGRVYRDRRKASQLGA